MSQLVTITGPIAAGKNTVADLLAETLVSKGCTVVVADLDDVAAMVAGPGAATTGLWFAAHEVHGALVAGWMRSGVDVVISAGPIYSEAEQHALSDQLPSDARPWRVLIDAPLSVTWERASADEGRNLSRQRDFHEAAHARFRSLMPAIPRDAMFDSGDTSARDIASAILQTIEALRGLRRSAPRP